MTKYCIYCGKEIDLESNFCSFCGRKQPEWQNPEEGGSSEPDELDIEVTEIFGEEDEPDLQKPGQPGEELRKPPSQKPAPPAGSAQLPAVKTPLSSSSQGSLSAAWKKICSYKVGDAEDAVKKLFHRMSAATGPARESASKKMADSKAKRAEKAKAKKEAEPAITCCICGGEVGFFGSLLLCDESHICSNCAQRLPGSQKKFVQKYWTQEDYRDFLEYVDYSDKELKPKFTQTNEYKGVILDAAHGLFAVGSGLFGTLSDSDLIYEAKNVNSMDFIFSPNTYKEGFIKDSVEGEVHFELELDRPPFYFQKKLESQARAEAQTTGFFSKSVDYGQPKDMARFNDIFFMVISRFKVEDEYGEDTDDGDSSYYSGSENLSDLQMALALFMYDSLDQVTEEDLKKRRNKLVKSFHPDSGDGDQEAAKKINNAYNLLKEAVIR